MTVWHKNKPILLTDEKNSLEKYRIAYSVKFSGEDNSKVIIECLIPDKLFGNNIGKTIKLIVTYPDNFPFFRPDVQAPDLNLPRHQNPLSKSLCLIGRASINWHVQTIGEYLHERLPLVFEQGSITDPEIIKNIPDEQAEPISEYYFSEERIFFTSGRPEILNQAVPLPSKEFSILNSGKLKLSIPIHFFKAKIFHKKGPPLKFHIREWLTLDDKIIPDDFQGNIKFDKIKNSSWYLLSKYPDYEDLQKFETKIRELGKTSRSAPLKSLNIKTSDYRLVESCCLIFPEEQEPGIFKWGWISLVYSTTTSKEKRRKIPNYNGKFIIKCKNLSLSPVDLSQRIPQSKGFIGKTIGIIGAGAIGAPTVIELAKNSCQKLKILDQDALELTNTVRWPLGMDYVGWNKVYALEDYIITNYPSVKVQAYHYTIGNPYNDSGEENKILNDFMNECDMIIDASGERGINHLISIRSWNRGIPYIIIEGRKGGWGGLVARILPNANMGCWMCLQNKMYLEDEVDKIPFPPQDNSGTIQEYGCGDITFTGTNFDLLNIPLAAVKLAANTFSTFDNFDWDVGILSTIDEKENPTLPAWSLFKLPVSEKCAYTDDLHT